MPFTPSFADGEVLSAAAMNSIGDAWVGYTPTWSTSTGASPTAGTITASYQQLNKTIHGRIKIQLTGSVVSTGYWRFTLPVTARSTYEQNDPIGAVIMQDFNVKTFTGVAVLDSTTRLAVYWNNGSTGAFGVGGLGTLLDKDNPPGLASTDLVRIQFRYEAA